MSSPSGIESTQCRSWGVDGARYWVNFSKEAIKRNYNLKVDVDSMEPASQAGRRKEIVQLMKVLGDAPGVNRQYLLKKLLREFDWVDAMRVLPQGQPGQREPMSARQYAGQQRKLMRNPKQLQERVEGQVERVQNRMEAMPEENE